MAMRAGVGESADANITKNSSRLLTPRERPSDGWAQRGFMDTMKSIFHDTKGPPKPETVVLRVTCTDVLVMY